MQQRRHALRDLYYFRGPSLQLFFICDDHKLNLAPAGTGELKLYHLDQPRYCAMSSTSFKRARPGTNGTKAKGSNHTENVEIQGSPKRQKKAEKQILLNAFDMSGTIGHLSPGQWKVSCSQPPNPINQT